MNTLSSLLKFIANGIAPIISNQTAKKVLAAPNGATGKPSFRELGASDITSGVFTTDRIPNLDASKINSGTLGTSRIPSLDASKTTSGVFAVDRIPNLPASRIPSLDAGKIGSGSFWIDVNTSGKFKSDGNLLLTVEDVSTTKETVSGGGFTTRQVDVAKEGYIPIGIIGFQVTGTNSQNVVPYRVYIDNPSEMAYAHVKNVGSSSYTIGVTFTVLYIAIGQGI